MSQRSPLGSTLEDTLRITSRGRALAGIALIGTSALVLAGCAAAPEDTDTGEISFQCVCGGIAMYYRRIVLNCNEVEALAAGRLNVDALVSDICKEVPSICDRILPSLPVD